jgi:hypothetical protein
LASLPWPNSKKAAGSSDPEIQRRAKQLVDRIGQRVLTRQLLEPTRVSLQFKETPLVLAAALLAEKSGQPIVLGGDLNRYAGRTVTLDIKDATYWEALEQFKAAARLVESSAADRGNGDPPLLGRPGRGNFGPWIRRINQFGDQPSGQIVLADGKHAEPPTALSGSARIRVSAPQEFAIERQPGEIVLALRLDMEAKAALQRTINVQITKAMDALGQQLEAVAIDPLGPRGIPGIGNIQVNGIQIPLNGLPMGGGVFGGGSTTVAIKLKAGEKPAKELRELTGVMAAEVRRPAELALSIDNILQAAGLTVKGDQGGAVTVRQVVRQEDGMIRLRLALEPVPDDANQANPNGNAVADPNGNGVNNNGVGNNNGIFINGMRGSDPGLKLVDGQGREFQLVDWRQDRNDDRVGDTTLLFKANGNQGEPAKLLYAPRRLMVLEVPFTCKNVPLP